MIGLFRALQRIGLERASYSGLGVLLCCLGCSNLPGQTPIGASYDVQQLRSRHRVDEARVEEYYRKQIPKEAIRPDGSVDTTNPEWQKANKQAARTQRRLRERYNRLENRPQIYEQAVKQTGAKLDNTGSPPKSIHADMDFTPETFADGHKLTEHFRKQGYKVDTSNPARWEIPELDAVIWKPYPNEPVGSSAKDAFVAQKARPGSDAYAPDGSMNKVSPYGAPGEEGAALGNVKKGLDARADLAAGRGDRTINIKEQAKAAWKASEWTGAEMDPELKSVAEKLKVYQGPEDAGVFNRGDSPEVQARKIQQLEEKIDASWKNSLEEGARKGARRNAIREQLANDALRAGDVDTYRSIRERAINDMASNEVTMQAMAEDYPAATRRLTGIDPDTPAGKEELLGRKSRVARELMTGTGEPLPGEAASPLIDRVKGLGKDALRTAGEVLDAAVPARAREFGGRALTGMFAAGATSAGYIAEQEAAIEEGRRATPHGVALEVLNGFTAIPFEHAREITEQEIMKSDAAQESRWWAAARALGEVGAEMSGHNMSRGILHEELLKEAERARELGREPHEWAGKVRAGIRVAGEMTLMNPIFEAMNRDFDAERKAAQTKRDLADYARANLDDQLETVQAVQDEIQAILENSNLEDPAVRQRLNRQLERFTQARDHLERTRTGIGGQIGFDNPNVALIQRTLQGWPDPADLENAIAEATKPREPPPEDDFDLDDLLAEVEQWDREHGWDDIEDGEAETESAGSGWRRKGELQTLSSNPKGDVFDATGGQHTDFDQGPAAPAGPEAEQLIQSAEAAAARCDFATVRSIAGDLSSYYPGHPWLSGRYPQIQRDESGYQAAQASLTQARNVLQRPEPTNGDIQQAAQIALQAQSMAPSCMSQQVSLLNGPIYQAQAAVQARNKANRQAGMQSLLGALVSVQSSLNSGRTSTGYQPSYSPNSGLSTLTSAISQATGGGTVPSGGASPGGGVSPGGGSAAPNCNSCIIGTFSFGNAYPYVFETSHSFSNQGGCTSGRARIYEVMSFPPDEDANGNPLRHANTSAARYLQAKRTYGRGAQTRQVCGPCGSAAQARSTVRRLCPRPAHSISGGPGGAVVDGRRVSPR